MKDQTKPGGTDLTQIGPTSDVDQQFEEIMIKDLNDGIPEPIEADEQAELRLSWIRGLEKKALKIQQMTVSYQNKIDEWRNQQLKTLTDKINYKIVLKEASSE